MDDSIATGVRTDAECKVVDGLEIHRDRRTARVPTLSVLCGPPQAGIAQFRQWSHRYNLRVAAVRIESGTSFATEWATALGRHPELRARAVDTIAAATQTTRESVLLLADSHARDATVLFERARTLGPSPAIACAVLGKAVLSPGDSVTALTELLLTTEQRPALLAIVDEHSEHVAIEIQAMVSLLEQTPGLAAALAVSPEVYARLSSGADARWKAALREGLLECRESGTSVPAQLHAEAKRAWVGPAGRSAPGSVLLAFDNAAGPSPAGPERRARSHFETLLFEVLEHDPETAGHFELNGRLSFRFGNRPAEVDIVSRTLGIAIEIDGYFHFASDHDAWRRDRRKDLVLQQHDYVVQRFLAEDVVSRLHEVRTSIRDTVRWRKRALKEKRL